MHASEAEPEMFGNRDTQVENNQNGFHFFSVFLFKSTHRTLCICKRVLSDSNSARLALNVFDELYKA